jgi:hypothetical protein
MENSAEMYRRFRHLEARTKPVMPYFDVRYYGAIGDGTADDTVAIQAAVTAFMATMRGCLLFPKGQYKITDSIIFEPPSATTWDKPMIIEGLGAEILVNVAGVPGFWFRGLNASNTFWAGLVFRGLQLNAMSGTPTAVLLFDDSNANNLWLYQFSLENLRIVDFPLDSNGITLINKFEYQILNVYVRGDPWIAGAAPGGNCVNIIQAAVGSNQQCVQIYANNLNTAFGNHALYLDGVNGAEFVGSTFSGAYAQGVLGNASNNIKFDQVHMEGNWRGGTPPGTGLGGFHKAGIYCYGGSYDIDVSGIEDLNSWAGAGEYRAEGFFTGHTTIRSYMSGSDHLGHVISLYDYGSPEENVTLIGINPDDVTFSSASMAYKTEFVGANTSRVISQEVGSELVTNGNFAAWTGDDPDSWALNAAEDANNYITQSPAGKAHIHTDATGGVFSQLGQGILTSGDWYSVSAAVSSFTSGQYKLMDGTGYIVAELNTDGVATGTFCAADVDFRIDKNPYGVLTLDDVSCKKLTLFTLFRYPKPISVYSASVSANVEMRDANTQAGIVLSVDDVATPANFVLCYIKNNDLTYKLNLFEYVAGVRTALISSAAITYVAGATLTVAKDRSDKCRVYYNGVQVGTEQTLTANTGGRHGIFSTSSGNILINFEIIPNG